MSWPASCMRACKPTSREEAGQVGEMTPTSFDRRDSKASHRVDLGALQRFGPAATCNCATPSRCLWLVWSLVSLFPSKVSCLLKGDTNV